MKRVFRRFPKVLLVVICFLIVSIVVAAKINGFNKEARNSQTGSNRQITVDQNGNVVDGNNPNKDKKSPSPTKHSGGNSDFGKETETPSKEPIASSNPASVEDKKVTLMAVGDDLVHTSVIESGKRSNGTYNYDHLFTDIVRDIKKSDLAVINQETVLGGSELGYSGYPRFNSPKEIGDAIVNAGFNVVLHATNHAMDKGEAGMQNSIDYWKKQKHVTVLGVNETEEEYHSVKVVEVNGIKIAMLNYTYSLNGQSLPKNREYMVNRLDKEKIRQDVALAKEQADFVIVFPHWGTEYVYEPSSSQKMWTKLFLETGVDLVIGAHPHVIEPVEWFTREDGHKMLVYYSLGNYVSGQNEYPRMLGGMAKITIESKNGGKPEITDASVTGLVTHYERKYENLHVYKLADYTEQLASKHMIRGMSVSKLKGLAGKVWGDWYKE